MTLTYLSVLSESGFIEKRSENISFIEYYDISIVHSGVGKA